MESFFEKYFEKYSEKYCRISKVQQKPIIFSEDHEFRNNSEFSEHRSSCSEISLRKRSPRCASLLLRSFSERNIESPFQGQQMAQLARTRCASGEVDWEDACPHSAGSETPSEKRTGSKRFRENCEECVSSETCSTHSPEDYHPRRRKQGSLEKSGNYVAQPRMGSSLEWGAHSTLLSEDPSTST